MAQSAVEFITEAFAEVLLLWFPNQSIINELFFHGTF